MIRFILSTPLTGAVFKPDSASNKRLRKMVDQQLEAGQGISSGSGLTALMAIEWCDANGYSWIMHGEGRGGMYYVERGEKIP